MTWPFENDTSAITKKLAKKSLQSEKRRNLMVVIAVALAAFLICFTGIVSTSLTQMQRNQVVDTYEAVWLGVEENDIETLKGLPEFERVGGYYMLGEELSEQGYHASYVYCDAQMMEITKAQMELLEGRVPEKANEVVVSEYFLSTYGNNAKIGDTVTLDTESFHGDYVVTGIMDSVNEKEANTCAIILSNAALTEWKGFDPTGYRAYVHFKNSDQLGEELMTSYCREIAEEYQLPMPKMNSKYFAYASKSFDFALMAGVIAIVLIGGYIVIQSIFRISINDKIKSYGQLRTIGATPKQIKRIVKREGRKLGSIGILIGTVLGVCGGFLLFSKGFNAVSYVATVILTLISSWIMVSVSIRKPVKIAAGISPIEAVRFTPAQKDIRSRKKNIKLNPVSMGIANFRRDRKKTVAIVASLSLGGIILLVVSSIVLLRSPEALARQFFPDGDYKIYLDSEMTEEKVMAAGNPLNEELKQEILSIDGVTDIIPSRQSLHATYKTEIHQAGGMCDMLTDQNYAAVEAALTEGTMPTDSRSIVIDYNVLKQNEDMGVGSTVEISLGEEQPSVSVTISGLYAPAKVYSGHGRIIEQTMNGRREKARQGGWNGGFAPYGYYLKDNQLLIEESEAAAIRIIFEKFAGSDIGYGGIAKYLNLQGIKKIPRQNGTLENWSGHLVRQILDNPVYCGKIAYGRRTREKVKGTKNEYKQVHAEDYILEDGQHEGIVSEELWQKVHAKRVATGIKQPSKTGKDRSHLLTGVLKCPLCGSPMYTNKHAWTNKDGTYKEVYYYICGRNKQERGHYCEYKASLRKTDIEPLVIEAIRELVSDKSFAKEIKKRFGVHTDTSKIDKELANYESKLKEVDLNKARLEREIDNLPADAKYRERKIHDMTIRLDGLYDTIVELEERIEDAKLRRSSIEMEAITLENVYRIMENFSKLYAIISDEEKKSLVSYLIKEIQIYPNGTSDRILKSIEFNFPIYRDGREIRKLLWENGNTVETVVLMSRKDK